jgi:PBP1b-binding outer membrane lipoprotein LpoB
MRFISSILFVVMILAGCASEDTKSTEWEVSPLFKSGAYTMIGQEGRLGLFMMIQK